jgi:hypothetical protein
VEAVVFVGIQASGKSSFYRARFFDTHLRINLDMLKTRHREQLLLHACIEAKQPFVVDNTNPSVEERARYIELALSGGFRVVGYYFLPLAAKRGDCPEQPTYGQGPHPGTGNIGDLQTAARAHRGGGLRRTLLRVHRREGLLHRRRGVGRALRRPEVDHLYTPTK